MLTTIAGLRVAAAVALLGCVVLAAGSDTQAQPADAWARCHNAAKPDIAGCTAIIAGESDKEKLGSAHLYRGVGLMMAGEVDKALEDFNASIALGSTLAYAALTNRGSVYRRKGMTQDAIADYRKALELDPTLAQARDRLRELGAL